MHLTILDPGTDEYAHLDQRLIAFNRDHVEWETDIFQVILRSEDNQLIGGARGIVRMQAVEVRGLWLDPEYRNSGWGERIIRCLEQEAEKRGAKSALLDTYDFQARQFYERLGYRPFGTFTYPQGTERHYLHRTLRG